ncbi:hypothetical protein [Streptomyces sp. Y1]|uniref:Uncharacterized protein n=1 Tax=Streptomyces sp. Y1 TaxID=3238634 RepID=A0AB39TP72_9ACTN
MRTAGHAGPRLRALGARAQAARHRTSPRVGRELATPLAGPGAVTAVGADASGLATSGETAPGKTARDEATPDETAQRSCQASGAGSLGARLARARVAGSRGVGGCGAGALVARFAVRLAGRSAAVRDAGALVRALARAGPVSGLPPVAAGVVTADVGQVVAACLVGMPAVTAIPVVVGRDEVRAAAVGAGSCAGAAGRVRFHRSGRLKTSHGSRLFEGEGPTGVDNAARAAGPPTG